MLQLNNGQNLGDFTNVTYPNNKIEVDEKVFRNKLFMQLVSEK